MNEKIRKEKLNMNLTSQFTSKESVDMNVKILKQRGLIDVDTVDVSIKQGAFEKLIEQRPEGVTGIKIDNPMSHSDTKTILQLQKEIYEEELIKASSKEKDAIQKSIDTVNKQIEIEEYMQISDTDEFQNFAYNYNNKAFDINYNQLKNLGWNLGLYEANTNSDVNMIALAEHFVLQSGAHTVDEMSDSYPTMLGTDAHFMLYPFMSAEEKMIYNYYFEKEGKEEAEKYFSLIKDTLTQRHGMWLAEEALKGIDVNNKDQVEKTLNNLGITTKQGIKDGIENWMMGLGNLLNNSDEISAQEYQQMYIMSHLSENSKVLEGSYKFSTALGNMMPSIAISLLGGGIMGNVMQGVSAGGNAKHSALINGHSLLIANIYGILSGGSEAAISKLLSSLPGLGEPAGSLLKDIVKEGGEELVQEYVTAGLNYVVLGEKLDIGTLSGQSLESFLMGMCMSAVLNGGQSVVNVTAKGINQAIDTVKLMEYKKAHNTSLTDAFYKVNNIKKSNPNMYDKPIGPELPNKQEQSSNEALKSAVKVSSAPFLGKLLKRNKDINIIGTKSIHDYNFFEDSTIETNSVHDYNFDEDSMIGLINELVNDGYNDIDIVRLFSEYGRRCSDYESKRAFADLSYKMLLTRGKYSNSEIADIMESVYQNKLDNRGMHTAYIDSEERKYNLINNFSWQNQPVSIKFIEEQISLLPKEVRDKITTVNIYDTFNPQDYYWDITYKKNDGDGIFVSAATAGDGTINIWANCPQDAEIIFHESGHIFDEIAIINGEKIRLSETPEYLEAMYKDKLLTGKESPTEYGENNSVEDFADSFALWKTGKLDQFPNRKEFIEKKIKYENCEYLSIYNLNKLNEVTLMLGSTYNGSTDHVLDSFYQYVVNNDITGIPNYNGTWDILNNMDKVELAEYYNVLLDFYKGGKIKYE